MNCMCRNTVSITGPGFVKCSEQAMSQFLQLLHLLRVLICVAPNLSKVRHSKQNYVH